MQKFLRKRTPHPFTRPTPSEYQLPMVVRNGGNGHRWSLSLGTWVKEIPRGDNRLLHQVDRGQATSLDNNNTSTTICMEKHYMPF